MNRGLALAPATFRARHLPRALELGLARSVAWAAATVIGLAIGGFVFHFPGSISASWDASALVFGTLLGGVTGLMVGVLQALALRGVVAGLGRQVWTMGVTIGATHGAYDGSRYPGAPLEIGAGIVAAGAVWLLLGERRAGVLAGVAIGWAVGLIIAAKTTAFLGMPWSETPVGWSTEHMVAGVVSGAIYAAAVVIAGLPGLERRPARAGDA